MENASRFLCLALDQQPRGLPEMVSLLQSFKDKVGTIKIHISFLRYGFSMVDIILGLGFKVWMDLKFDDTPHTVEQEMAELIGRGINFISIHLRGGSQMIKKAVLATGNRFQHHAYTRILGITVLTTIDQTAFNEEQRVAGPILDHVLHLVRLGLDNGVRGFVCSGAEAPFIRKQYGPEPFIVTPGVFMETTTHLSDDHKRMVTPHQAICNGSDLVVIGRGLLNGGPAAADQVLAEIKRAFITERVGKDEKGC